MILWFLYRIVVQDVSKINKKINLEISSSLGGSEHGVAKVDGMSSKGLGLAT
jgi:hypothetical protein